MMYMSAMSSHSAPVDTVIDNGDGTYSCTVYYLMAGTWDLEVTIGSETTMFHPDVAADKTAKTTLKGQTDLISNMTGTAKRNYYLFRDGVVTAGTSTFNIFIAAKESMTSYPAISTLSTTTLHDENNSEWDVTNVAIQASTNGTTWTSDPAIETAKGHWSIGGIAGLSEIISGATGTVYVKLNINGEDKSVDGLASNGTGTNMYAAFKVTPQ
jgi:hypothetical protein